MQLSKDSELCFKMLKNIESVQLRNGCDTGVSTALPGTIVLALMVSNGQQGIYNTHLSAEQICKKAAVFTEIIRLIITLTDFKKQGTLNYEILRRSLACQMCHSINHRVTS